MATYESHGGIGGARGDRMLDYMAIGRELDERWREQQTMEDTRIRDLDETRRLCYMALVYERANGRHELAGTLINALLHHQRIDEPVDAVIEHVLDALVGGEGLGWLRQQIDRINEELG